jgi:hypothetical protein
MLNILLFSFREIVGKILSSKYVKGPSVHCHLTTPMSFSISSSRCLKGMPPSALSYYAAL